MSIFLSQAFYMICTIARAPKIAVKFAVWFATTWLQSNSTYWPVISWPLFNFTFWLYSHYYSQISHFDLSSHSCCSISHFGSTHIIAVKFHILDVFICCQLVYQLKMEKSVINIQVTTDMVLRPLHRCTHTPTHPHTCTHTHKHTYIA